MQTLISVIIPTFGTCKYLYKAVESVISQSYKNWELIIVDDNNPGTDARKETETICRQLAENDDRIKYIQHEHNLNGAVARNTGFAIAKGEYISLLDSDDEYMPDRLQKCYEALNNATSDVAGVYTGCEFRKGGKVYYTERNVPSGNFLVETLTCKFMFCTGSNIFVRKSVVDELNGFDPTFLRHQDYEFLVRVFEKYSLIGLPEVLVVKNNENLNVPNVEKLIAIKKQYLNKYSSLIDNLPIEKKNTIYYWNNIAIAEAAMAQKDYRMANQYYKEAQNYGSLSLKTWFRRIVYPIYNLVKSS